MCLRSIVIPQQAGFAEYFVVVVLLLFFLINNMFFYYDVSLTHAAAAIFNQLYLTPNVPVMLFPIRNAIAVTLWCAG